MLNILDLSWFKFTKLISSKWVGAVGKCRIISSSSNNRADSCYKEWIGNCVQVNTFISIPANSSALTFTFSSDFSS